MYFAQGNYGQEQRSYKMSINCRSQDASNSRPGIPNWQLCLMSAIHSKNKRCGLMTFKTIIILVALSWCSLSIAQDRIYRCGNEYTTTPDRARENSCVLITNGSASKEATPSRQGAKKNAPAKQAKIKPIEKNNIWYELTVYQSEWSKGVREPINKANICSLFDPIEFSDYLQSLQDLYENIGDGATITSEKDDNNGKATIVRFKVTIANGQIPWEDILYFRDEQECLRKSNEVQFWYKEQYELYKQKWQKYN